MRFLLLVLFFSQAWGSPTVLTIPVGDSLVFWLASTAKTWDATNGKDTLHVVVSDSIGLPIEFRTAYFSQNQIEARKMGIMRTLPVASSARIRLNQEQWHSATLLQAGTPRIENPQILPTSAKSTYNLKFLIRFSEGFPIQLAGAIVVKTNPVQRIQTICAPDSLSLHCSSTYIDSSNGLISFQIQPTLLNQWTWPPIAYQPIQWEREPQPLLSVRQDSTQNWIIEAKSRFSDRVRIDSLRIQLLDEEQNRAIIDTLCLLKGHVALKFEPRILPWNSQLIWKASWYAHGKQFTAASDDWQQRFPQWTAPKLTTLGLSPKGWIKAKIAFDSAAIHNCGISTYSISDSSIHRIANNGVDTVEIPYIENQNDVQVCLFPQTGKKLCLQMDLPIPTWRKAEVGSVNASEGIDSILISWKVQDSSLVPWISSYSLIDQCPTTPAKWIRNISRNERQIWHKRTKQTQCLKIVPQQIGNRQGFCISLLEVLPRTLYHSTHAGHISVQRKKDPYGWIQELEWTPSPGIDAIEIQWMDSLKHGIRTFRWDRKQGDKIPWNLESKEGSTYFLRVAGVIYHNNSELLGPADTLSIYHPRSAIPGASLSSIQFHDDSLTAQWKYPIEFLPDVNQYELQINGKTVGLAKPLSTNMVTIPTPPPGIYALSLKVKPKYLAQEPTGETQSLVISKQPTFRFCPGEDSRNTPAVLWGKMDHAWKLLSDTLHLIAPKGSLALCPEVDDNPFPPYNVIALTKKSPFSSKERTLGFMNGSSKAFSIVIHPQAPDSMLADIAVHELAHAFFYSYRKHPSKLIPWEEALATWVQWRVGLKGPLSQPDPGSLKDFPSFESIAPSDSYPYWIRFRGKSDSEMTHLIQSFH